VITLPAIPLDYYCGYSDAEILARATTFHKLMQQRRTVRDFSDKQVSREVIEAAIATAGTAPSGANLQPWYFVAISNPALKQTIRMEAEIEERDSMHIEHPPNGWLLWLRWVLILINRFSK
jgi:iodotyrosine deiodinase